MTEEADEAAKKRWESEREALAGLIARWTGGADQPTTAVSGLGLFRKEGATETSCALYERPSF